MKGVSNYISLVITLIIMMAASTISLASIRSFYEEALDKVDVDTDDFVSTKYVIDSKSILLVEFRGNTIIEKIVVFTNGTRIVVTDTDYEDQKIAVYFIGAENTGRGIVCSNGCLLVIVSDSVDTYVSIYTDKGDFLV